jgi:menaquinone-specific isochorismate synthase
MALPPGAVLDHFVLAAGGGERTTRFDGALTRLDALVSGVRSARPGPTGACFVGRDVQLSGRGAAAVLGLPRGLAGDEHRAVVRWLAAVAHEGGRPHPGTGPVAIGALPFAPDEAGALLVPALTVGGDGDGRRWLTVVWESEDPAPDLTRIGDAVLALAAGAGGPAADAVTTGDGAGRARRGDVLVETLNDDLVFVPVPSEEEFVAAVEAALQSIEAGDVAKVVLQRDVEVTLEHTVDLVRVLRRFHTLEPDSTVFAVVGDAAVVADQAFVGATPELMIRRRAGVVFSHPLAGTVRRADDPDAERDALDRFWSSPKERAEHRWAADAVAGALAPWCSSLEVASEPEIVRLHEMAHLGTPIRGVLRDGADALALTASLHPTPAVAGTPTEAAMALIARLEPSPRGLYAGPVGWVDANGDGDFMLGIRSASIDGGRASVHAGVGVVAGSDPKEELAETTLKLGTALAALRP